MDYHIPEKGASARPFVFAVASYLVGFVLHVLSGAPLLTIGLMLAYSINASVMFMVTLFWKISVHAAGVTGAAYLPSFQTRFSLESSLFARHSGWSSQNSARTAHVSSDAGRRHSKCCPNMG